MVVHKQKKNKRQKAGTTHGWGSMKKHRGAGSRGGRGNAGTGKRGDAKKPSIWKNKRYFGVHGFGKKPNNVTAINLKQIDDNAISWAKKGLIEENSGVFKVNLNTIGYDKLLGTGTVTKKLQITVKQASQKAIDKVSGAGGKVELPEAPADEDKSPVPVEPSPEEKVE